MFRQELGNIQRLVVKVGSNVVTDENGLFEESRIRTLVQDILWLRQKGVQTILVSSGAVNAGKNMLDPNRFKKGGVEARQAASSLGQPKLMQRYCELFESEGAFCSQILLTHEDFKSRQRYLNAKRTLEFLLASGVTPIVNENDTVSFVEITLGDNDNLAARTALISEADALLIVTSARGLFDRDPEDPEANMYQSVEYGADLGQVDTRASTPSGTGGMKGKLEALSMATGFGVQCIVASKENPRVVVDPLIKKLGTYFYPKQVSKSRQKKIWLSFTKRNDCVIEVDEGAREALLKRKSLLPAGILGKRGRFSRGECVALSCNEEVFGYGVCFYDSGEVEKLAGLHTSDISRVLGEARESEIIHADNIILETDWS